MSVRMTSYVWDLPDIEGTELLVMLAMADFADDAGRCWPSMDAVAKRARRSGRAVRTIIRNLEARGLLECSDKAGGRGRSNRYLIVQKAEAQTSEYEAPVKAEKAEKAEAQASEFIDAKGGSFELKAEVQTSEEPLLRTRKKERATDVAPKKSPASVLSPLLGNELAAEVVEHRQRLRKPMTVKAAELLLREFEKCTEPIAGAEMMIARGWQGFNAQWMENDVAKQRTNGRDELTNLMRIADDTDRRSEAGQEVDDGAGLQPDVPLLAG